MPLPSFRATSCVLLASCLACVPDARSAVKGGADSGKNGQHVVSQQSAPRARRLAVVPEQSIVDVAPDGKTALAYRTGTLQLRDIATGSLRDLVGSDTAWIVSARLSRDGARVYYTQTARRPAWDTLELRVRDIATASDRVLRRFVGRRSYIEFGDESRDGTGLFVSVRDKQWTWQIARIALTDGAVTPIKSFKWRSPGPPRVSPDGRFVAYDVASDERSNKRDIYLLTTDGEREVAVTATPNNERLLGWAKDGSGVLVTRDAGGSRNLLRIGITRDARAGAESILKQDVVGLAAVRVTDDRLYYLVSNQVREVVSAPLSERDLREPDTRAIHVRVPTGIGYAVSPDGGQMAYTLGGENDGNGPVSLFVRSMASASEREIELPVDYIWNLQWSRQPQELLAVAQKRGRDELYRIDLRNASVALVANGTAPCGGEPTIMIPLTAGTGETSYYLRPAPGPEAELVSCRMGESAGRVLYRGVLFPPGYALAPDGRTVAVIEHKRDSTIVVLVPTQQGTPRDVARTGGQNRFTDIAGWTSEGLMLVKQAGAIGGELWRIPIASDSAPVRVFHTDRGRGLRYLPATKRAIYTLREEQLDELWVMERLPGTSATSSIPGTLRPNADRGIGVGTRRLLANSRAFDSATGDKSPDSRFRLTSTTTPTPSYPRISPNGRRIAYTSRAGPTVRELWAMDHFPDTRRDAK